MFRTTRPQRGQTSAPLRHRAWSAVAAVALGASVLTGCAAGQISQTADQIANIDGAQGSVGPVGVHNVLLAAPEDGAYPKGSTAPLTLWVSNNAFGSDKLTAITTSAGSVSIGGDATIPAQGIIEIGGSSKVTAAVDVATDLKYGFSVPMTFSFENAGDLSLNVPIEIPEQRTEPRPTVNIYPEESPNIWNSGEAESTGG